MDALGRALEDDVLDGLGRYGDDRDVDVVGDVADRLVGGAVGLDALLGALDGPAGIAQSLARVDLLAGVGGLLALTGVGLFLWGRNNLSKAGDRRGDLN